MDTTTTVDEFFARYAAALVARDEETIARMYAVPGLILFPGNAVPITDEQQTAAFFASSWPQYDGVAEADSDIAIMAEAPGSVWADVTWSFDGQPRERFCYQLVGDETAYRIGVLTPMELPA